MAFQEYHDRITTEILLGSLQGKKWFWIEWSTLMIWSSSQQKRGIKGLIFFPFKWKGNIKPLCDAERTAGSVPSGWKQRWVVSLSGDSAMKFSSFHWDSVVFLHLGSCTEGAVAAFFLPPSSPPPTPQKPHTTVSLLCIMGKGGKARASVLFALISSF